jgi:hypothetical protein
VNKEFVRDFAIAVAHEAFDEENGEARNAYVIGFLDGVEWAEGING